MNSPCIRRCCLDDGNVCLGCYRSLDEIVSWHDASAAERRRILARANQRRDEADIRKDAIADRSIPQLA